MVCVFFFSIFVANNCNRWLINYEYSKCEKIWSRSKATNHIATPVSNVYIIFAYINTEKLQSLHK